MPITFNILRKALPLLMLCAMPALAAAQTPTDSLPAQEPEIKPFSRDIAQTSFIPKGQWIAGVSVSYSQSSQNNYQFLVVENLNGNTYSFKVAPTVLYAFHDNMAAGGRLSYTRQRTKLDEGSIVLDSETSYDADHLYSITHNYYASAVFRDYLSLGAGTRFGMFAELQLEIGGGQSKLEEGSGLDFSGTYSRNFSLGVGVAPGLVMFLNNYSAIEVNVGVLGFDYRHTHSVTDRIHVADTKVKTANFRINLFSITFGCTFYI